MTSEELHAYEQALDDVENPCTHPVGAPGSAKRRANDLGLKLASMTKRAEEAEKTCDDYMIDIEALGRKGDAAEVKLAMAVQGLQRVTRSDYFHAQRAIAEDTLRALGVEPGEVGR